MENSTDEIKKVVSIDVSQAVSDIESLNKGLEATDNSILDNIKTFKDYKNTIETLSVSLSKLDESSDEYDKTLKDLNTVQDAYSDAMAASKKQTDAAAGSYNALSKEMSELKKAWKATNDEAEREALGEKIAVINDKLKGFDTSIGNYQRNVGNYASAFTEGLDKMGERFAQLNNPMAMAKKGVQSLNGAFKALIANPIGAVIAAIVLVVKGLVDAFKNNEEASNKLKKAFSAFEPIVNLIKKALGAVVNVIGDLAVGFSKVTELFSKLATKYVGFLNKIGILSDKRAEQIKGLIDTQKSAVKESQGLADAEIALEKRKRKEMVETAKTEAEISELKLKATDTDKYTAKERAEMYQQAINLERKINEERLAIAAEELRIAKARADQAPNSKADNDNLAQVEANYYKVKKEYTEKAKELNSQLVTATKTANSEISSSVSSTTSELEDETEALQKLIDKLESDVLSDIDKSIEAEENAQYNEFVKSMEAADKLEEQIRKRQEEDTTDPYALRIKRLTETYQIQLALLEENGRDTTELTRQFEDDKNKIILEKEKELSDQIVLANQAKTDSYLQMRNDINSIMGSIGDTWQTLLDRQVETGKISEKEYKKRQKALQAFQIASVIGSSAAAIFDIWSGYAKEVGAINAETAAATGPAAAATKAVLDAKSLVSAIANTATIAATAASQIASIRSASSGSSSTSSAASTSSATATISRSSTAVSPNYTQSVMGSTDVETLKNAVSTGTSEGTQAMKVYVLESDITEAQNSIKTIVKESEF